MTKNQFIFVLIITFIVIAIWITADIIHTKPSVPANPKVETLLDPVNPTFDKSTLDKIKQNQIPISVQQIIETQPTAKVSSPPIKR